MRRWLIIAGVGLCLLVLALALAGYLRRLELTTRLLERELRARGVPAVQLRVTQLGPGSVTIRGLSLGAASELQVGTLQLEYEIGELAQGRIRSARLEAVRLQLDLREGGAPLGSMQPALDALLAAGEPAAPSRPFVPLPRLRIERARVELLTSTGPIAAQLDLALDNEDQHGIARGELHASASGLVLDALRVEQAELALPLELEQTAQGLTLRWHERARATLSGISGLPIELEGPLVVSSESGEVVAASRQTAALTLAVELPALALQREGAEPLRAAPARIDTTFEGSFDGTDYAASLHATSARIELRSEQVALDGLDLVGSLGVAAGPWQLAAARLVDLQQPQRFPQLLLRGSLTPPPAAQAAWPLRVDLSALDQQVSAGIDGTLDLEHGRGALSASVPTIRFAHPGLQPADLYAALGVLRNVTGGLRAAARLRFDERGVVSSSGELSFEGASFDGPTARVEGLDTTVSLESLLPPRSKPGQTLGARQLRTGGVRFDDAQARFRILEGGAKAGAPRLLVEEASLRLGQGRLRVADLLLDAQSEERRVRLEVDSLRLEDLFALADVADLAGVGVISGAIPITVRGDGIEIRDGLLVSTAPGVLRIRSAYARAALESAGQYVELLVDALEDFHFELLRIGVEKPVAGTSKLAIHLLGNNPAVLDGHPFALNINVETDLEPLLRAASLGTRLSEEWASKLPRATPR